jgi:hypothetical protein
MKIIDWIRKKINASYDRCYLVMKENFSKSADEYHCPGMHVVDSGTVYLSHECLHCPHLKFIQEADLND